MNNVYELPKREDKIGEVSEWIARVERGLTEQEETALQDWLAAKPKNPEMFMSIESILMIRVRGYYYILGIMARRKGAEQDIIRVVVTQVLAGVFLMRPNSMCLLK